ncbi:MAG: FadR family transcriptional regulator, partial [Bacilli bacterium]
MERLRIQNNSTTLVDQVEDRLLNYFKEKDLQKGD